MKSPDFLHVDTNSHKLKVDQKLFGWVWSKMGVWSQDTKIGCISRRNKWSKLIFGVLIKIQEI